MLTFFERVVLVISAATLGSAAAVFVNDKSTDPVDIERTWLSGMISGIVSGIIVVPMVELMIKH